MTGTINKPRLLIPISIQFGIRYLVRTGLLERITEYAQPVILLSWEDQELQQEMEQAGAEVHLLPESHFGPTYIRLRRQIDAWHLKRLRSPSTAIDRRRVEIDQPLTLRLLHRSRALRNEILRLPGAVRRMLEADRTALRRDTNLDDFELLLYQLKPDALLTLTPFHRQEELLLRAAELQGLPQCAAILSFDNLTTRGWIPVIFDRYLLWNHYNVQELRRAYPETLTRSVAVVGAPQFDFYWDRTYLWEEIDWRKEANVPADCPVILFGGGLVNIVPHEPYLLSQLDAAIEQGEIPGQPVVLFRRHPLDRLERWLPVLRHTKHVIQNDPWPAGKIHKYTNIRRHDIEKLASTLRYTDAHVNVSSTMTVDGAIYDKPQIGPAYDDRPGRRYDQVARELYEREHFVPITRSGGLHVAYDRNEMIRAVTEALRDPTCRATERMDIVNRICTYADGQAARRVALEIGDFVSSANSHSALLIAQELLVS